MATHRLEFRASDAREANKWIKGINSVVSKLGFVSAPATAGGGADSLPPPPLHRPLCLGQRMCCIACCCIIFLMIAVGGGIVTARYTVKDNMTDAPAVAGGQKPKS